MFPAERRHAPEPPPGTCGGRRNSGPAEGKRPTQLQISRFDRKFACGGAPVLRGRQPRKPELAMKDLNLEIARLLQRAGLGGLHSEWEIRIVVIAGILLVSYLATKAFRRLIIPALQKISSRTRATWDDHLFQDKVMHGACRLIPPIVWYILLPLAFDSSPVLLELLRKGCLIYLIVVALMLVSVFLDTLREISDEHETLRNRPLQGIYQMIKLLSVSVGCILVVSILIGRDATTILAGLGASAAVLMLIFRDSILGLVAGVQLSANDMLRPGDWITMAKYGADGYVTEVSLTTVKVQNFDKTITTIPPYALVSDSFQNWRGMRECGGRRIKRSVLLDASTVRFCTPEETERLLKEGLAQKEDLSENVVNTRIFRSYMQRYLKSNPGIRPDLLQMVRTLQPTSEGIPVEIYCFTKATDWIPYETFQSALFDHIIAILPRFGLRIYQRPAGTDFRRNPTGNP